MSQFSPISPRFQIPEIPWESPIHPRHGKHTDVERTTAGRAENALGKAAPSIRKERLEPGEPK